MKNKERGLRATIPVYDDACDNKADIDELLSYIGQIPDEYIERGKYLICELEEHPEEYK